MISELFFNKWKNLNLELSEQISQDIPDYKLILEQIQSSSQIISKEDLNEVRNENFESSSISSFFKAKNAAMIQYIILLNVYILQKLSNGSLDNQDQLIEKLLENRILISKMTNTQKKLQYQVDKILQISEKQKNQDKDDENEDTDGKRDLNNLDEQDQFDQLAFKPRPEMLTSQIDNGEEILNSNFNPANQRIQKYVPPKLAASLQKDDMNIEKKRKFEERRKEYLKNKLMNTLMEEEADDAPQILDNDKYNEIYLGQKQDKNEIKRIEAEENQFQRIQVSKQDKKRMKYITKLKQQEDRVDNLGDLKDINTLLRMEGLADDFQEGDKLAQKPKSKKGKSKKFNKRTKFFKFKKHN